MPDEIDLSAGLIESPKPRRVKSSRLDELISFAKEHKLTVGSTTGGRHNTGSKHYTGNAIDIKGSGGFDDKRVNELSQNASLRGFELRDERRRPKGQKVWGGAHVHIESGDGDNGIDLSAGVQDGISAILPSSSDTSGQEIDLSAGLVDEKPLIPRVERQPIEVPLKALTGNVNEMTRRMVGTEPGGMENWKAYEEAAQNATPIRTRSRGIPNVSRMLTDVTERAPRREPTIQGQRLSPASRVASEAVLEGAAGWTQAAANVAQGRPMFVMPGLTEVLNMVGLKNVPAEKLQEATNALRQAAQKTDTDPATGKPFRDAMSYWQSVPLDVLQGGVKAGFDIPRYVLLSRAMGPVGGFATEGVMSSDDPTLKGKAKAAAIGAGTGAAFKVLGNVPALRGRTRQGAAQGVMGAGQSAGEQYVSTGEVDPRAAISSAITMGGLGAVTSPRRGRRVAPEVENGSQVRQPTRTGLLPERVAQRSEGVAVDRPQLDSPAGRESQRGRVAITEEGSALPLPSDTGLAEGLPAVRRRSVSDERAELSLQRFFHRDWGEVVKLEDQSGARPGKTKVAEVDNPDRIHFPKTADLTGKGNQRLVPIKEPTTEAREVSARTPLAEGEQSPSTPIRTREDVREAFKREFNLPDEQADAVSRIADARAETWAKGSGKTKEEWYRTRIADITQGKPAEGALFQESQPFFSQLSRVVDQKMPNRASADQLKALLESPQSGVKVEEVKWTGLDDFLAERKGQSVTKQEVQEFLKQNAVEVTETLKGKSEIVWNKDAAGNFDATDGRGATWELIPRGSKYEVFRNGNDYKGTSELFTLEEAKKLVGREADPNTKFEKFQLPGGENYRELLLTLPDVTGGASKRMTVIEKKLQNAAEYDEPELNALRREYKELADKTRESGAFQSSHFDEPNILAHIRFNDRVVDGKKTLLIEEVQSDWHQRGRKEGYQGELTRDKAKEMGYSVYRAKSNLGTDAYFIEGPSNIRNIPNTGSKSADAAWDKLTSFLQSQSTAVPDAPFKKTWHELAMKRVLRHAAENGYDKVAWTTGEIQAERYDLSKHIDAIKYRPKDGDVYSWSAIKDGKQVEGRSASNLKELEDYLGKEIAQKIAKREGAPGEVEGFYNLSGLDLKVGGEGMKGFYDQILPSFMNKYGKKWGARVEKSDIELAPQNLKAVQNGERWQIEKPDGQRWGSFRSKDEALREYGAEFGIKSTHSVDITPSMKKSVMEGQPLFQGKKASTEFLEDNRAIIRALEKPDVSSAVHELAHVFRRDLETDLLNPAEEWAGVKDGKWKVEHEEKFARGFERYLREGKAPTEQLRQVFGQFKEWLTNIYRTLKGSPLEQKLSPEIRRVFDEMLGESTTAAKRESVSKATAPKDAAMQADRDALGIPELARLPSVSASEVLERAKAANAANPRAPDILIEQAIRGGKNFTNVETMQVNLRAQEVKNRMRELDREIADETNSRVIAEKAAESDALIEGYAKIIEAQDMAGAEWSRAGRARQQAIGESYELEDMIARFRKSTKRVETPAERATLETQASRIAELETQLVEAQKKAEAKAIQKDIDRIRRQTKRGETKDVLDAEFVSLKTEFAQARMEAKGVQASGLAGLDPEGKLTPIILKMARNRAKLGTVKAEQVIDDVYSAIKEHIEGVSRDDVAKVLAGHDLTRDPLPAIKTRLRNQQADLTRRLEEKDFTPPLKRPRVLYDREASDLKAQVESLKRQIDAEVRGHDSLLDTVLAMRKAGLLTGLKTHARNIGGTGGFQVFEEVARMPGALADLAVSTVTKQRALGAPNPIAVAKSSYEAATKGLQEARQVLKYGTTAEEMARYDRPRELNSGSRLIDAYVNTVFRVLGAEDRVFRTYAFKRSIEDQARLRSREYKRDVKDLIENPTPEMASQAILDAEVATLNNQNKLAQGVEWIRSQTGRFGATAIDLIVPFRRTPANIASRLLESTPLGAIKGGVQLTKAAISKKMSFEEQRKFSQTMGRSVTGSGLMLLGWKLAEMGLATGLSEDNVGDREIQKASGRSPLSIRLGKTWHQIGAFSPIGNLLAVGAALFREQHRPLREGEERGSLVESAIPVGAKTVLEQPFLKGMSGVVDALESPHRRSAFFGQTAGSFVPTGVSDLGALIDNKRRQARGVTEKVQSRVPFLREHLPEGVDVFGRPLQSRRSASVDPTLTSTADDAPFIQELVRLDVGIPKTTRRPDESESQYRDRVIAQGKAFEWELTRIVALPRYQSMKDDLKIEALKNAVEKVRREVNRPSVKSRSRRAQVRL